MYFSNLWSCSAHCLRWGARLCRGFRILSWYQLASYRFLFRRDNHRTDDMLRGEKKNMKIFALSLNCVQVLTYLQRLTPPQSRVPKVAGHSLEKKLRLIVNCMLKSILNYLSNCCSWVSKSIYRRLSQFLTLRPDLAASFPSECPKFYQLNLWSSTNLRPSPKTFAHIIMKE